MVAVLDSSIAINGLLRVGPSRDLMEREQLHVPHLADSEVLSTLARLTRHGTVKPERAQLLVERWTILGVHRHPVTGLLDRMWQLRDNVRAYDASYVALAEWLGIPLITRDKRLSRAPGIRCEVRLIED